MCFRTRDLKYSVLGPSGDMMVLSDVEDQSRVPLEPSELPRGVRYLIMKELRAKSR